MTRDFSNFVISPNDTVYNALSLIDTNRKGFLIVVEDNKVVGALTDGDIRRAMLTGKTTSNLVADCYTRQIKSVKINDGIGAAIDLFKNESIKFLPVISEDRELVNRVPSATTHKNHAPTTHTILSILHLQIQEKTCKRDLSLFARFMHSRAIPITQKDVSGR